MLVYFGYPRAHEDAGRRAVSAALELIETVERLGRRHNRPLKARVGVDTGVVFIGQVGGKTGNNLAVGEAVPRAARLQTLAAPNRVVVSQSTQQLAKHNFEWRSLGSVELKGLAGLVAIYEVVRVLGAKERVEAARGGQVTFVEQGSQLPALTESWTAAKRGQGRVVVLTGEPGLGKTRNAAALADLVRGDAGWLVHASSSSQYQSSPLHPFLETIRAELELHSFGSAEQKLAAVRASLSESEQKSDTLPLLAAALSLPPSAGFTPVAYLPQRLHAATVQALRSWLLARAGRGPTLLILEDLHWADPSTVEVLIALGEAVEHAPLMVLITSRPGWENDRDIKAVAGIKNLVRLTLGRLPREASLAIVSDLTEGRSLPPAVLEQILERAADLPLFVEEMTRAVLMSESLRLVDGAGYQLQDSLATLKVPATLQDALAARLDLLGPSKSVVQLAAAIGFEVQLDVLCAAAGQEEEALLGELELVERAGLIHQTQGHPSRTFAFRHALIQQQAYEDLPSATRRTFHREIARAIQSLRSSDEDAALLAYHHARADEPTLAATAYARVGASAINHASYFEAAKAYTAAIEQLLRIPESTDRDTQELALVALLGFTLLSTRGFSDVEVEKAYRRAFDLCSRLGSKAPLRVLYGIWAYNLTHGGVAASVDISPFFESSLAQSPEPLDRLTVNVVLGVSAFSRGDFRGAHRHLEPASALVDLDDVATQHSELLQRNGFDGVLNTLLFLAWTQLIEGNAPACRANIAQALDAAERSKHPYVIATALSVVGSIAHHLRDSEIAQRHGERLMGLAQENHFLYWMGGALCMLGWAHCAASRAPAGQPLIEQGIGLFQAMGDAYVVPYFLSYLAEAQLEAGRFGDAAETIDKVLALSEGRGTRAFVAEFERLKGEALLGLGEQGGAEDRFRLACAISRVQGAHLFRLRAALSLARLMHAQARNQEAVEELRPALGALAASSDVAEAAAAQELLQSLSALDRA